MEDPSLSAPLHKDVYPSKRSWLNIEPAPKTIGYYQINKLLDIFNIPKNISRIQLCNKAAAIKYSQYTRSKGSEEITVLYTKVF
jgi:hypothetical protein